MGLKIESLDQSTPRDERCAVGGETEEDEAEPCTVTGLTAGVHDPNRVNVFLNGKFAFSLEVAQACELRVKVGQVLDTERLATLRRASEFGKLYRRTLEWALARPRSVRETRDYLLHRQIRRRQLNRQRERDEKRPLAEIETEVANMVVDRLVEKGYVDDQKFAEFYTERRCAKRGISRRRLSAELQKKGLDADLIDAVMSTEPRDEHDEIMKVIAKKRKKYDDDHLIHYLARQGFEYLLARQAVDEYNRDHPEECN